MVLGRGVRLLAPTGIALVAVAAVCGVDKESYVGKNERILETLPEVPGAERLRQESSPYYLDEMGPADGYTTNVVYQAPLEMTDQQVLDFYVQSLPGWQSCLEEIPITDLESGRNEGRVLSATFVRGSASLTVMTDGMLGGAPHTYEISIDHRTYRNFCTGEDLR